MTQPDKNNLLLALVGFAQQQYENFITEVFAHLLRHLLMHDPKVAREVLKKLTGNRLRLDSHTCADVKIDTQTEFPPHGRPDIVIRMPRQLVIVEVKVDAEVSPGQISRYRKIPPDRGANPSFLVLWTRFEPDLQPEDEPDWAVRWYELAEWLEAAAEYLMQESSRYLCNQFLDFLKERGLTMEHVGRELIPGIQALSNFRAMLDVALKDLRMKITKGGTGLGVVGWRFQGPPRKLRKFWIGFEYSQPTKLCLYELKGRNSWESVRDPLDMSSEDEPFCELSKKQQIKRLKTFIQSAVTKAKRRRP